MKDYWDSNVNSNRYVTGTAVGKVLLMPLLREVLNQSTTKPLKVLEIGPGMGKLVNWITKTYPDIDMHALDISPKVLERINLNDDCKHLEYDELGFDVVICHLVIQHLNNEGLDKLCAGISKVCHGLLFFQFRLGPTVDTEHNMQKGLVFYEEKDFNKKLKDFIISYTDAELKPDWEYGFGVKRGSIAQPPPLP